MDVVVSWLVCHHFQRVTVDVVVSCLALVNSIMFVLFCSKYHVWFLSSITFNLLLRDTLDAAHSESTPRDFDIVVLFDRRERVSVFLSH